MRSARLFWNLILQASALYCFAFPQPNAYSASKDGGFVVYPESGSGPGPVVFSHRSHGNSGAGFSCSSCHGADSKQSMQATMDDIRHGRLCGKCHDDSTKAPATQKPASSLEDCKACHAPLGEITMPLNRMDPVSFSHTKHLFADPRTKVFLTTGYSCRDCHPTPFDRDSKGAFRMEVPHENGACAQCHNGRKGSEGLPSAFAATTRCLTCHKPL